MNITVSAESIKALGLLVTGNTRDDEKPGIAPYKKGWEISEFFKPFVAEDVSPVGSRWDIAEQFFRALNEKPNFKIAVEKLLDPRRFHEQAQKPDEAVAFLNGWLIFDRLELKFVKGQYRLLQLDSSKPKVEALTGVADNLSNDYIVEELGKCDEKLATSDYKGAITNARSLVESTLRELETRLTGSSVSYDGDLPKLYKRVSRLMNLDPGNPKVSQAQQLILSGLSHIVHGLAPYRSELGDAHGTRNRPEKRHAKLAVNCAMTMTEFLLESYEHQKSKGLIKDPNHAP